MSVIIQNQSNPDEIILFMKGADNIILNKLDENNKINQLVINNLKNSLEKYSKEGLRILAVAFKIISLEELLQYQKDYIKASKDTYKKKEKLDKLAKDIEKDLIILGITAIEDELQDDVNETLKDFSEAGIKLWVLTGDKKDTAKSIAYSCGLFDDETFNIFEINEGLNKIQLESRLNELVELFNNIVDKMNKGKKEKDNIIKIKKNDNKNNINENNGKKDIIINVNQQEEKKEEILIDEDIINDIKTKNNKNQNEKYNNELNDFKEKIINNENIISTSKETNINEKNKENKEIIKESSYNKKDIQEKKEYPLKFALIISSDELNILSLNYELEILFYELSSRCNSVLCCRVSPIQKAKMVHLIQRFTKLEHKKGSNYYKYLNQNQKFSEEINKNKTGMNPLKDSVITLAIGDGANDVNMITSAHVGVGIIGVEGKQAARASDYAIGQFKFLKKLLFYHGHESLRRNSFIIYYNFYKNFLFVMPQFYVGFYSLFSGQSIYDPWLYQLFNIVFSVFPLLWFGIYDTERDRTVAMSNAKFYSSSLTHNQLFDNCNFWRWIFNGIFQGLAVFIFVFFYNNTYPHNNSGEIQDFKSSGMMTYSLVVIIVNLKVFSMTSVHGVISIFFLIFSIGSYYFLTYLMCNQPNMFYFGVFLKTLKNIRYFLIIGLLCIGFTFISAGFVKLNNIMCNYEKEIKQKKIMFQYYRNKEVDKKKKNQNKKMKKKLINKEKLKNDKKDIIKE